MTLDPGVVREAERLLRSGHSARAVAKALDGQISRSMVQLIAQDKRRLRRGAQRPDVWGDLSDRPAIALGRGRRVRCPLCRRRVSTPIPCLRCLLELRGLDCSYSLAGERVLLAEPLGLELRPEEFARYLEVKAARVKGTPIGGSLDGAL